MDWNTPRTFLILVGLVMVADLVVGLRFVLAADRLGARAGRDPALFRRIGVMLMVAAPIMFAFLAVITLNGTIHFEGAQG